MKSTLSGQQLIEQKYPLTIAPKLKGICWPRLGKACPLKHESPHLKFLFVLGCVV